MTVKPRQLAFDLIPESERWECTCHRKPLFGYMTYSSPSIFVHMCPRHGEVEGKTLEPMPR